MLRRHAALLASARVARALPGRRALAGGVPTPLNLSAPSVLSALLSVLSVLLCSERYHRSRGRGSRYIVESRTDPQPILAHTSYAAGPQNSDWFQVFNPTWVQASPATGNRTGLLVRSQNCQPPRYLAAVPAQWPLAVSRLAGAGTLTDGRAAAGLLCFCSAGTPPADAKAGSCGPTCAGTGQLASWLTWAELSDDGGADSKPAIANHVT